MAVLPARFPALIPLPDSLEPLKGPTTGAGERSHRIHLANACQRRFFAYAIVLKLPTKLPTI